MRVLITTVSGKQISYIGCKSYSIDAPFVTIDLVPETRILDPENEMELHLLLCKNSKGSVNIFRHVYRLSDVRDVYHE